MRKFLYLSAIPFLLFSCERADNTKKMPPHTQNYTDQKVEQNKLPADQSKVNDLRVNESQKTRLEQERSRGYFNQDTLDQNSPRSMEPRRELDRERGRGYFNQDAVNQGRLNQSQRSNYSNQSMEDPSLRSRERSSIQQDSFNGSRERADVNLFNKSGLSAQETGINKSPAPFLKDREIDKRMNYSSEKSNVDKSSSYDVDNTGINVRDRNADAKTPFDQSESSADLKITQDIRKALVDDNQLSMDAKNIKVITQNGVVVLRGPVVDQKEISIILDKISKVPGVKKVDNFLEVTRKH
ncbi:outer membrane lipoprotein [Candidatus Rubidus massiliensis]|nr:outer membrane lipoprotein [Candidatus Rubidus massiliensis]